MDAAESTAALTDLTSTLDTQIKQVRKATDLPATLAATAAALDRLDVALATNPPAAPDAQIAARQFAMRISYNAAADAYPGWEPGLAMPTPATLAAAQTLALRSQAYVEQLGNDPMKAGNALWLLGALNLTANNRPAALADFTRAANHFATAPEMHLMARGYATIAAGAAGLDDILTQLTTIATEDAIFLRDQLMTAREMFHTDASKTS